MERAKAEYVGRDLQFVSGGGAEIAAYVELGFKRFVYTLNLFMKYHGRRKQK